MSGTVPEPKLEMLEIIENDAHDVLFRLCLRSGHVFDGLKALYFRSTNGCDFYYGEHVLHEVLPQLAQLKTLTLVLGNEYADPKHLTELFKHFPPSIETLRFRSMIGLAKSKAWPEWIKAFRDEKFLPKLQMLSFILDMKGQEDRNERQDNQLENKAESDAVGMGLSALASPEAGGLSQNKRLSEGPSATAEEPPQTEESKTSLSFQDRRQYKVPEEDLRLAKRACEQLWKAAEGRGVIVEPFTERNWLGLEPIDERWEKL